MLDRAKRFLHKNRNEIFDFAYSVGMWGVLIGLIITAYAFG